MLERDDARVGEEQEAEAGPHPRTRYSESHGHGQVDFRESVVLHQHERRQSA